MTEKDLMQIRSLCKEERYLRERIGELESKMYSLQSPSLEPSYGGNGEDVITALIESRDELFDKLVRKQTQIYKAESWLEDVICEMSSEERMVIRLYYIKAVLDWDTVANMMQYSARRVFQFRDTAVAKLSNIAFDCTKFQF